MTHESGSAAHGLVDVSPDDGGEWWWACSCDAAAGGYEDEAEARAGWEAHRAEW